MICNPPRRRYVIMTRCNPSPAETSGRLALPLWHETYAAPFAPTSRREMDARGWEYVDVVFVTGDAYIDHPSFAMAILHRVLEQAGFRVAMLSQPDWHSLRAVAAVRPAAPVLRDQRRQHGLDDQPLHRQQESPQRRRLLPRRPNRPAPRPRHAPLLPSRPRSLPRRADHRRRRRGVACAGSPITITGPTPCASRSCWTPRPTSSSTAWASMPIVEIARRLAAGKTVKDLRDMRGIAYAMGASESARRFAPRIAKRRCSGGAKPQAAIILPSFEEVRTDKHAIRRSDAHHPHQHQPVQRQDAGAVSRPPGHRRQLRRRCRSAKRRWIASTICPTRAGRIRRYTEPIPAYEMIKDSVTIMRGCFGGCTFCSITTHQGRTIQSRSQESILNEVRKVAADPEFKGVISDIGGPTANMYQMRCTRPKSRRSANGSPASIRRSASCSAPTTARSSI